MSASTARVVAPLEADEPEHVGALTDREHAALFGWAWDDPDAVEVDS